MTHTPRYTDGPVPRAHYAATATGSTDSNTHRGLMFDWYGLRPVRGAQWRWWARCPHKLAGKKCPKGNPADCDMTRGWRDDGRLWDHARAWRNGVNDLVYTLEPYGNPFDAAADFAGMERELKRMGLVTSFEGRSPYGASYIIFVASEKTPVGQQMAVWSNYRLTGGAQPPQAD